MVPLQATPKKSFDTLDGIRGLAAIAVVLRHQPATHGWMAANYLAVDLFFLLSGFVLAYRNDQTITSGNQSAGRFFLRRIIRIYPLYFCGSLLGAIAIIFGYHPGGTDTIRSLPISLMFSALVLPTPLGFAGASTPAYPLNSPALSLAFELVANCAYGAFAKFATVPRLATLAAISLLGLIAIGIDRGTIDEGSTLRSFVFSFPRVSFSFSVGVIMFKAAQGKLTNLKLNPLLPMGLTLACFLTPTPPGLRWIIDVLVVLIAFPAIIWLALHSEPTGYTRQFCMFIGFMSYPLYAIQAGVIGIMTITFHSTAEAGLSLPLAILTVVIAAFASLLAGGVDRIARNYLEVKLLRRNKRYAIAEA